MARNSNRKYLKLAWAPWHNVSDMNTIPYNRPNSIYNVANNLTWKDGRELMNNALFHYRTNRAGTEDKKRNVNLQILFNVLNNNRETIQSKLQEDLRRSNPDCQVWLARLQIVANPVRVGRIFYSAGPIDVKPIIKRILSTLIKETKVDIEASISMEAAFEDNNKRKTQYKTMT
eukprot:2455065-Ditylum_brightwellii.AAC.1